MIFEKCDRVFVPEYSQEILTIHTVKDKELLIKTDDYSNWFTTSGKEWCNSETSSILHEHCLEEFKTLEKFNYLTNGQLVYCPARSNKVIRIERVKDYFYLGSSKYANKHGVLDDGKSCIVFKVNEHNREILSKLYEVEFETVSEYENVMIDKINSQEKPVLCYAHDSGTTILVLITRHDEFGFVDTSGVTWNNVTFANVSEISYFTEN